MVRRRLQREPLAYITGRRGFRRIELAVDRRVLVPRPETELLVELALELRAARRVLDVGTGSGADRAGRRRRAAAVSRSTATDISAGRARRRSRQRRAARARGPGPLRTRLAAGRRAAPSTSSSPTCPMYARPSGHGLAARDHEFEPRGRSSPAPTGSTRSAPCSRALAPAASVDAAAVGLEIGDGPGRGGGGAARAPRASSEIEVARAISPATTASSSGRADGRSVIVRRPAMRTRRGGARAHDRRRRRRAVPGRRPLRARLRSAQRGRRSRASTRSRAATTASPRPSSTSARSRCASCSARSVSEPATALGALLPGPVTPVVANPDHRYPLACREDPARLGVRLIEGPLAGAMCPLFQTSANRSGEPAPSSLRRRRRRDRRCGRPGDRRRAARRACPRPSSI